ncbi:TetR/AcrR family transcriptional regulator [Actinomyces oris]|uniref:TetR/AcrR family transcriptional regulator n=1 Tax=Actinomyces oris TaxID=544580 RepID=UPI00242C1919|nr:TetR/AcrR family transcriptional regulator [Actinomyces oris]
MRADAAINKRQLLDSAAQLLAEQGPQVSLRTIAKQAGVGVATLYRHFPTRESLEEALVLDTMSQVADVARWFCGGEASQQRWQELAERLGNLRIGALADRFADDVHQLSEFASVLEQRARTLEEVEAALAHAHDAGLVHDDVLAVRFIMGIAVVARPLPSRAAEMVPDQAEWLMTTYLAGLAPR